MIIFLSNDHNELMFMEEIDVQISKNKNCNQLRYMVTVLMRMENIMAQNDAMIIYFISDL